MQIENRTYRGPAIYSIWNTETGKLYFGQAINYGRRAIAHVNAFKRGNHFNKHLQRIYNNDPSCLVIAPFEITDKVSLTDREKFWIDFMGTLDESKGYNMVNGGRLIQPIAYTKERREKVSNSRKEYWKSEEGLLQRKSNSDLLTVSPLMKGRKRSQRWKDKMIKIREQKVAAGIRFLPGRTVKVNVYSLSTKQLIGTFDSMKDAQIKFGISNTLLFNGKPSGNWNSFDIDVKDITIEKYGIANS